jgi:hypothetical protein
MDRVSEGLSSATDSGSLRHPIRDRLAVAAGSAPGMPPAERSLPEVLAALMIFTTS